MIDSMAIVIPYAHTQTIQDGATVIVDGDGVIKWQKERFRPLEGSFECVTMVQTEFVTAYQQRAAAREKCYGEVQHYTHIKIEGSPAKFLQGHNLFGSENLLALSFIWVREVFRVLDREIPEATLKAVLDGDFKLQRVDIARMLDCGTPQRVADTLAALDKQATYTHKGRGIGYGTGCRWGNKKTRTTVVKAYDKHLECTRIHPMSELVPEREGLKNYALGSVRFEVEIHSKTLDQKGLRKASAWHSDTPAALYEEAMKKLDVQGQMPLTSDRMSQLPWHLQGAYAKWITGMDVKASYKDRTTFHRHRTAIKQFGIDIAVPYSDGYKPKVIALSEVIRLTPKPIPQWAYGTVLLAAA